MHGRDLKPEELATILGEFVNGGWRRGPQVGEACTNDHRTIQRNIFCLCLDIIDAFARIPQRDTDMRNEESVKMARQIQVLFDGRRPGLV